MTRPLSNDLRERDVAAVGAGESCRAVALRFEVSVASVVKRSQRENWGRSGNPLCRRIPRASWKRGLIPDAGERV